MNRSKDSPSASSPHGQQITKKRSSNGIFNQDRNNAVPTPKFKKRRVDNSLEEFSRQLCKELANVGNEELDLDKLAEDLGGSKIDNMRRLQDVKSVLIELGQIEIVAGKNKRRVRLSLLGIEERGSISHHEKKESLQGELEKLEEELRQENEKIDRTIQDGLYTTPVLIGSPQMHPDENY